MFCFKDLGWMPFVSSWIAARPNRSEHANLSIFFETYVPHCLDALRTRFKTVTPLVELCHVQTLCSLLTAHLIPTNLPHDSPKETYEMYFVFCAVWAFGGALDRDQLVDYRAEFSKWWLGEFKSVKFPSPASGGTSVFDYYIDTATQKFEPWSKRVGEFILDVEEPLQVSVPLIVVLGSNNHISEFQLLNLGYYLIKNSKITVTFLATRKISNFGSLNNYKNIYSSLEFAFNHQIRRSNQTSDAKYAQ